MEVCDFRKAIIGINYGAGNFRFRNECRVHVDHVTWQAGVQFIVRYNTSDFITLAFCMISPVSALSEFYSQVLGLEGD
jgi:hypothetical protein